VVLGDFIQSHYPVEICLTKPQQSFKATLFSSLPPKITIIPVEMPEEHKDVEW
jgi:hypothetical protein